MGSRTRLSLVAATLLGLGAWLVLSPPDRQPDAPDTLPWKVTVLPDGNSRALGLTLGQNTLEDARRLFGGQGELSLFVPGDDTEKSLEAFFEQVRLHGLRAKVVLVLGADDATLAGFYDRGIRISSVTSGGKRVTLHPDDAGSASSLVITHITYLPLTRLDRNILEQRFGAPAERVDDALQMTHWLYPDRGIDVAMDASGKTVIQYSRPADFRRIVAPLR